MRGRGPKEPKEPHAMAEEEVLEQLRQAEAHKEEGNARFKAGEYRRALGSYHKVFCYVNGLTLPGERSQAAEYASMLGGSSSGSGQLQVPREKAEDVAQLKRSTHLNMAACYLKVGMHQKCIASCGKVLAEGPNSKASFRCGQAHLELGNLDEAKENLDQARQLEPANAAIVQELRRLKAAFAQHDAKEKKRFARIFNKMSEESTDEAMPSAPEAPAAAEVPADS